MKSVSFLLIILGVLIGIAISICAIIVFFFILKSNTCKKQKNFNNRIKQNNTNNSKTFGCTFDE